MSWPTSIKLWCSLMSLTVCELYCVLLTLVHMILCYVVRRICELADQYKSLVFVDESHSL